MFADIPESMLRRMRDLEARDARDRQDGTPRLERLRQVPPATGASSPSPPPARRRPLGRDRHQRRLLGDVARARGARARRASDHVRDPAREGAARARDVRCRRGRRRVELREADAIAGLDAIDGVSFCFLDAEKDVYLSCWRKLASKLVPGGSGARRQRDQPSRRDGRLPRRGRSRPRDGLGGGADRHGCSVGETQGGGARGPMSRCP